MPTILRGVYAVSSSCLLLDCRTVGVPSVTKAHESLVKAHWNNFCTHAFQTQERLGPSTHLPRVHSLQSCLNFAESQEPIVPRSPQPRSIIHPRFCAISFVNT
ncbi:hypothetical protein BJX99DRAFT_221435 [Aspergillus californicus]